MSSNRIYACSAGIISNTQTGQVLSPASAEILLTAHNGLAAYWGDRTDLLPSVRSLGISTNCDLAWEISEAIREARTFEPEPHVNQMQEAA